MSPAVRAPVPPPVVPVAVPTAAAVAWRSSYPAVPQQYDVRVETGLERDSAGTREAVPVVTTARVAFTWPGVGGMSLRRVRGQVSDLVVRGSDRVSDPAARPTPVRTAFEATLDSAGVRIALVPALVNECDAPATAAVPLVRELLVRWPSVVEPGMTWRDSVLTFACRGGVPMTTRTRSRYEVVVGADSAVVVVRRTSELEVTGELRQPWRSVRLVGRGTGGAEWVVVRATGAFRSVRGTSDVVLEVSDAARAGAGSAQRVRQRTTLVASPVVATP
jgi:hypothetical protein